MLTRNCEKSNELTIEECQIIRGGSKIPFEETFISPFRKDTYEDAYKVLEAIRSVHSAEHGWREIEGYVETMPNGKYRAVRKHVHNN